MFAELDAETAEREEALHESTLVEFLRAEARFIGPRTLRVGEEELRAERIVIAAGTRPVVPPIRGLEDVPYLMSDDALRREEQPRRLVIIGGGYIAVELAHFFGGLGAEVTMLVRGQRLLDREDEEISAWLTREYQHRFDVRLGAEAESVAWRPEGGIEVRLRGRARIDADAILVATGRRANSDLLDLERGGIEVDARGYVAVNPRFEAGAEGVYAFGDIIGGQQLKHVAVREAKLLARGLFEGAWGTLNAGAVPHAVFSSPQVAGVGATEAELRAAGIEYRAGRHEVGRPGWAWRSRRMGS